ncbi:hypothetical protein HWV62_38652 [Athelia sp. TMB]|nr:hypothetical protein HWV62_38652 [Athelia sp. TMB]
MISPINSQLNLPQDQYHTYGAYGHFNEVNGQLRRRSSPADIYITCNSSMSSTPSLSPARSLSSAGSRFPSPASVTGRDANITGDSRYPSPASSGSSVGLSRSSTPTTTPASSPAPPSQPKTVTKTVAKRGQPPDHIKRPANAYICFRSEFCKSKPAELERHNANVSKITGLAWRQLGPEERRPYEAMAERKKAEFVAMYPDWVFKPRRDLPAKKPRKKQTRTADDAERYMRIALGFNSGKRDKELKEYSEVVGSATTLTPSSTSPRARRTRKTSTTKRLSAKARAQMEVRESHASAAEPQAQFSIPAQEATLTTASPALIESTDQRVPLLIDGYGDYHTDLSQFLYRSPIVTLSEFMADSMEYDQRDGSLENSDFSSYMSDIQLEDGIRCPDNGMLRADGWIYYDYPSNSEYGF